MEFASSHTSLSSVWKMCEPCGSYSTPSMCSDLIRPPGALRRSRLEVAVEQVLGREDAGVEEDEPFGAPVARPAVAGEPRRLDLGGAEHGDPAVAGGRRRFAAGR